MLGTFAVKSAILCGSVSDPAESFGILDLPLNKDALYKDAVAKEHLLSLSKDSNERCICQNSEWGLTLAVETDRHKKVSIHNNRQFALNVTRIRRK